MAENTTISPKLVKFLDVVVQTTIWIIWKFRNNMVFSKKRPSKNLLLNDIKLMSYTWISSRYRKACLNCATVAQAAHAAQAATATHSSRDQRPSLLRAEMDASVEETASVILATANGYFVCSLIE
ncbi:hypothetical protein Tco_0110878 [Tanacetum coccineum]